MSVILVAEGEGRSRRLLQRFLESRGMATRGASTAEEAAQALATGRVDLAVVGLGAGAVRQLRSLGMEAPVVSLLGEDSLEERRRLFLAGADSWLRRPVDPEELLLVLCALSRRWCDAPSLEPRLLLGETQLDQSTRELRSGERALGLSPREYGLLSLMLAHPRRVFSRRELLDRLWELGSDAGPRAVDAAIRRLRARCGPGWGFRIEAVRGVGYRLVQEQPEEVGQGQG